jgi:hypothetical protein
MSQANRKDRSFEQILAESQKQSNENMIDLGDGVMVDAENVDFVNPSEEELFRLAGGTPDMLMTGKAGAELRSILAQRVRFCFNPRYPLLLILCLLGVAY